MTNDKFPELPKHYDVDRSPALALDVYVFPKSQDWKIEGAKVFAIPGTWFKNSKLPAEIICLVSCPNCKNVLILHSQIQKVDHKGRVTPDFKCNHCEFHRKIYLDEIHNKPLYACAIENFVNNKVVPEIVYCQGINETEARYNIGILKSNQRLVAIGRAIGFFAGNKDGTELLAEKPRIII